MKDTARLLRGGQTPEEEKVWALLRRHQSFAGTKWRRQHPIKILSSSLRGYYFYVLDFYCPALNIAIELDGSQHNLHLQEDQNRDQYLRELGIIVHRFDNQFIHTNWPQFAGFIDDLK